MEDFDSNPLKQYFRQPGLTIKLPSMGRFQDPQNVKFTATGEVAILPMRAADELLMKSPDALMSGLAIESAIKSCVPDVKDPRQLPTPDVDAILLAIRAATYHEAMEVGAKCPNCGHENSYGFDVNSILETITPLEEEYPVRLNDELVVYLRPFNFEASTKLNLTIFQETRKMQVLDAQEDISDLDKQHAINETHKRLSHMNIQMIADSVEKVVIPSGTITNRKHISEFIHQTSSENINLIQEKIKEINISGVEKDHPVECAKCHHEWKTTIEFDPSNFFGHSS